MKHTILTIKVNKSLNIKDKYKKSRLVWVAKCHVVGYYIIN